jgi:glycerophosphoryl diester phosphodiesterase
MAKLWIKILKIFLLLLSILFGVIFTTIGAYFIYTTSHAKGNCKAPKEKIKFAHRSNTALYQENTLEAILSTVDLKIGAEFDVDQISTGELVIFHDDNAKEVTGVDLEIKEATLEQIRSIKYLETIRGKTYSSRPSIPLTTM